MYNEKPRYIFLRYFDNVLRKMLKNRVPAIYIVSNRLYNELKVERKQPRFDGHGKQSVDSREKAGAEVRESPNKARIFSERNLIFKE